ncbi:hypothetical protein FIU89_11205 [Roseovarius sp. THAF27]|uniref:helix-turn-helix domain-containing protein n=1 Tax=Roseovarius sp. THAF27 TaxID=2587850 RepID=UPI0012693AA3|nr:helix-turn-helix domain-containing protein [Roseovarius sp. THAF27]QFT81177.1 hypothetical protein FIU89_11205 [Roseovarius sp. THAF27]
MGSAAAYKSEIRLIAANEWKHQRFSWLEGVRRDADLSDRAKLTAHVLALDFTNAQTMRCDPSFRQIAEILGRSQDTAKRAVRELIEAGWLTRDGGLGRGNNTNYGFLTRAKIIHLKGGKSAPPKGGNPAPYYGSEKGADLHGKGGKSASSHNIDKPWENHGARAGARTHAGENRFSQAEIEEARQLILWVEKGGNIASLQPAILGAVPRLIWGAIAEKMIAEADGLALIQTAQSMTRERSTR